MYSYVDDPNTWVDIHGLTKTYHANDKRSTKAQHGYYILDKDKNVVKVGVSSGRIKKNGKSARAEKQVIDFNNNPDKYPDSPYSSKKKTDISSQKNARKKY